MTQHDPPAVFAADASTVDLPMQTRLDVRLMAESAVAETRTIEVVWSTGAPVRRRDPWSGKAYEEMLSLDPAHVDLTRLNGGAPLLNTHGAFDLEDVIGVVERAWVAREGGTYVGRATVRFSDRADVEPIWQDVRRAASSAMSRWATASGPTKSGKKRAQFRSGRPSTGSRLSFPPFRLVLMVPRAFAPIPRQHPVACCGRANPLIPLMKRIPQ